MMTAEIVLWPPCVHAFMHTCTHTDTHAFTNRLCEFIVSEGGETQGHSFVSFLTLILVPVFQEALDPSQEGCRICGPHRQ